MKEVLELGKNNKHIHTKDSVGELILKKELCERTKKMILDDLYSFLKHDLSKDNLSKDLITKESKHELGIDLRILQTRGFMATINEFTKLVDKYVNKDNATKDEFRLKELRDEFEKLISKKSSLINEKDISKIIKIISEVRKRVESIYLENPTIEIPSDQKKTA